MLNGEGPDGFEIVYRWYPDGAALCPRTGVFQPNGKQTVKNWGWRGAKTQLCQPAHFPRVEVSQYHQNLWMRRWHMRFKFAALVLVHSCDHLIAGQATAADKHHMPKIAVLLIQLARLVAHWKLAVGTNRRPDTRLFLEGLCHGTTHLRWLSGENKMAKWEHGGENNTEVLSGQFRSTGPTQNLLGVALRGNFRARKAVRGLSVGSGAFLVGKARSSAGPPWRRSLTLLCYG